MTSQPPPPQHPTQNELTARLPMDMSASESRTHPRRANFAREAMYSITHKSISGVNVMSALRPRLNTSLDRTSIYSVRSVGTAQGTRRRRTPRLGPEEFWPADSFLNRTQLSPQEQNEFFCSRRLVEKLRGVSGTSRNRQVTLSATMDAAMMKKELGAETVARPQPAAGLDGYLSALLERKQEDSKEEKFMYFNVKESKENAYDLEITDYAHRNPVRYYTISKKGVTQYTNDMAIEFSPLKEWLVERALYGRVRDISFFRHFHRWKLLNSWHTAVWSVRKKQITDDLEEKLFCLDPIYRSHLLRHSGYMCELSRLRLLDMQKHDETGDMEEFSRRQEKKRREVATKVREYSSKCRTNIKALIMESLARLRSRIMLEKTLEDDHGKGANAKGPAVPNQAFEALGFPQSMAYGHRSALRRECSRFLRVAYLADFMSIRALGEIYVSTVADAMRVLEYLDHNAKAEINAGRDILRKTATQEPVMLVAVEFDPSVKIPKEKIVSTDIRPFTANVSKTKEFDLGCHVELLPPGPDELLTVKKYTTHNVPDVTDFWLRLAPSQADFHAALTDCMSEGLHVLETFERWSRHEEMVPYAAVLEDYDDMVGGDWQVPDSLYLNVGEYIARTTKAAEFQQTISSAYQKCQTFVRRFAKYLNWYRRIAEADLSLLFHERTAKPAETLANVLRLLEYQKKRLAERLPETCNLGVLKLTFAPLRRVLIPAPAKAMQQIETLAGKVIRTRVETIKEWMETARKKLDVKVGTVEDYVRQKVAWNDIADRYQETKDKIDAYGEIYDILGEFAIQVKKDDKQCHTEAVQGIGQLTQMLADVSDQQELSLDKFRRKLQEQLVPQLQAELGSLRKDIEDDALLARQEDAERVTAKLDLLETRLKSQQELCAKYNEFQERLDVELTDFDPALQPIKLGLELRSELWRSLKSWATLTQIWVAQPFSSIDAKEMGSTTEEYTNIATKLEKALPENPVSKELLARVDTFNNAMPAISALRNPALRKQHWSAVTQLMQTQVAMNDPSFTLGALLDLKPEKFEGEILKISIQAEREALLEGELKALDERWKKFSLTVKQYGDKEGVYVLDRTEELFDILDESLVSVSAILGDKYIKPLLAQAEDWREKLESLQTIAEEWVTCQRGWIHLEGLGPEVRRELGAEAGKFDAVDKFFRGLMQRAVKTPQPPKLIKTFKGDLLDQLKHCNKSIDEIARPFQDYLESKRRLFPRFYFLSADELLEIVANSQIQAQLAGVQRALPKLFGGMARLEVHEGTAEVLAFASPEGERVALSKPVRLKEDAVAWLEQFQASVRETLPRMTRTALSEHDELDNKEWLRRNCGQVVLSVSHVIWCDATETAIGEWAGNENAMVEWYEENVGMIKQASGMRRTMGDSVGKAVMSALLVRYMHARDVIEELILAGVSHQGDFEWQKELRFYWEEDETVLTQPPVYISAKQMNARFDYGTEYVSPTERIVLVPETVRAWVGITGALNSFLSPALTGPRASGKTETVLELARTLGIPCTVLACSGNTSCRGLSRAFLFAAQQGAWVCLSQANGAGEETLSVAARLLWELHSALARGAAAVFVDEKEVTIRPGCGIFFTLAPITVISVGLPENLKRSLRPVAMCVPETAQVAEKTLSVSGFSQSKLLGRKLGRLLSCLCDTLSSCEHYDFSLRAATAIIARATEIGFHSKADEVAALFSAVKTLFEPRLLPEDFPAFRKLLSDFFPSVLSDSQAEAVIAVGMVKRVLEKAGLGPSPLLVEKSVQLSHLLEASKGVIIVGPTGSGKSTMTALATSMRRNAGTKIAVETVYPKTLTMEELFGGITREDSIIPRAIREASPKAELWLTFDGPMDHALTTALRHCMSRKERRLWLSGGDLISLGEEVRLIFETDNMRESDPGTVAGCGVVYLPEETIGWRMVVEAWANRTYPADPELKGHICSLFEQTVDRGLTKLRASDPEFGKETDSILVSQVCNLVEAVLPSWSVVVGDKAEKKKVAGLVFSFAFIWGVCGNVDSSSREKVSYTTTHAYSWTW